MPALTQQIQSFFEQAKFFDLTAQEVEGTIHRWEVKHGKPAVLDVIKQVDPLREIFKYPVTQDELLRIAMTVLRNQAQAQQFNTDQVHEELFKLVDSGHSAEAIAQMMAEVDPGRLVYDHPIRPDEKGIHGLELWVNRYQNCSDTYGHRIDRVPEISEAFSEACEQLWEEGVLYDCGGLCIDKTSRHGGYVVSIGIEDSLKPVQADLDALKAEHGLNFECISMVVKKDPKAFGASVVISALITELSDLPRVPVIAEAMRDIEAKWQKRLERQQLSSQDCPF